jgi:hypothetical protein
MEGRPGSSPSGGFQNQNASYGLPFTNGMWNASYPETGITDFYDYTNTNKLKTYVYNGGQLNASGTSNKWITTGLFNTTAAITSITILTNGASFNTASFGLYGLKGN